MAPQRTMRLKVDNKQHSAGSQPLGQPSRSQHRVVEVVEAHPDARKVEARELGTGEQRRRLLVLGDEVAQVGLALRTLYTRGLDRPLVMTWHYISQSWFRRRRRRCIRLPGPREPKYPLVSTVSSCFHDLKTHVGEEPSPAGVVEDSPAGPHGDEIFVPPQLLLQHRQGLSELLVIVGAKFTSRACSVSNQVIRSGQKRGWAYSK
ncbi:unnamed protein product [Clonostachys chloroleuca]|uniref:Uncharacterized protein n=1 Tax=Clonostachys chloroleuca TaxID=1926264 RepID=A0AA35PX77_9HYPO|nr:unnamed protein product [Clonostachys chloroleuca]